MREARYRFSEHVRSSTRAIALRMVHAGAIASSPEELDAWIAGTDDIRARLTDGGYGSEFGADDLFPLFQAFVAKATAPNPTPSPARPTMWLWVGMGVVIVAGVIVAITIAS